MRRVSQTLARARRAEELWRTPCSRRLGQHAPAIAGKGHGDLTPSCAWSARRPVDIHRLAAVGCAGVAAAAFWSWGECGWDAGAALCDDGDDAHGGVHIKGLQGDHEPPHRGWRVDAGGAAVVTGEAKGTGASIGGYVTQAWDRLVGAGTQDKLPMPIKAQILEAQKHIVAGDLRGAEQRLSQALAMGVAHDAKSPYLVTIHSKLANVCHALQQWDKAKEHYVATLSFVHAAHRASNAEAEAPPQGQGTAAEDLGVGSEAAAIELSLKIAECYTGLGNHAAAHKGIEWSIRAARSNFQREQAAGTLGDNTVAMLGMALNAMGTFMSEQGRHSDAATMLQASLDVATHLSLQHRGSKMMMVHNQLASAHAAAGHSDEAVHHAEQAALLADQHAGPEEANTHWSNFRRLSSQPIAAEY